ncbi:MAG: CvpA family protein [Rickettsiales bacterium]|jgi:membrane protein required for colicin V production|nr:CvpA family protein [Rickettsiales bacterium]
MLLDYIFIGVMLASTLWAFARGGVFELVATTSWILAALAARFVSPKLELQIQNMMGLAEPNVSTLIASYFIVFFLILILFSLFAQRLRDYIHSTILRSADRSLGIIFGLVRGVFINGFLYIAMLWYWSGVELPAYVSAAKTRPVMQITALKIYEWFIPGPNNLIKDDLKDQQKVLDTYETLMNPKVRTAQTEEPEDDGYKNTERQSLDNQLSQIDNLAADSEEPSE